VDVYVDRMSEIIKRHQRELGPSVTVVDLGCGDFKVGRRLAALVPEMEYVGCDIVPELILHHRKAEASRRFAFSALDIVTDDLPVGDSGLVRQVLQHLPNADVQRVLNKLGKYHAVYITEGQPATREGPFNPDKPIGSGMRFDWQAGRGRGLEFDQPPFNVTVTELFRTSSTPYEEIVTVQLHSALTTGLPKRAEGDSLS
jgi:SAM-dependent methyltransferase